MTKTESGELGSAVNTYIERIRADRSIVPSFNTFYEYMRDDYRRELAPVSYTHLNAAEKKRTAKGENRKKPAAVFVIPPIENEEDYLETVSYTHLDVYKRQVLRFLRKP